MTELRPFPLAALPDSLREALEGRLASQPSRGAVLTTVEDLPLALPDGVSFTVLPGSERREVVVGAAGPMAELPAGTRIGLSPGPGLARRWALLRALHPRLEPTILGPGDPDPPSIRLLPLWPDPQREASGEVLDEASWLPAPGQGIPVLLHDAGSLPSGVASDPAASAVARAERAFRRGIENGVACVRGRSFGVGLPAAGLRLTACALSPDGGRVIRGALQAPMDQADALGVRLAQLLRKRGGDLLPAETGP